MQRAPNAVAVTARGGLVLDQVLTEMTTSPEGREKGFPKSTGVACEHGHAPPQGRTGGLVLRRTTLGTVRAPRLCMLGGRFGINEGVPLALVSALPKCD